MYYAAILFSISAISSYFLVSVVYRYALRKQIMDIPNERSSHTRPTPRGGGAAIVIVAVVGIAGYLPIASPDDRLPLVVMLLGMGLIAFVSWWDDLYTLSNRIRFGVHALAAIALICVCHGGWQQVELPYYGVTNLSWGGYLITFLWLTGLTNAFNFMDGIDGIAGTQAIITSSAWILLGIYLEMPEIVFIGLILSAGSLGFLVHNWPPAKIFMGDIGSTILGFVLAAIPLIAAQHGPRLALVGVVVIWPFVFDTVYTMSRRAVKRENIFKPHRSHLYQRLAIAGWSHQSVTLFYGAVAVACASGGVMYALGVISTSVLLAYIGAITLLILATVLWCERNR